MLFLGKAEVIEEYDRNIKTTSIVIKIPAVVRLLSAFRRHKKPVKFSRINIYGRDKYTCQYCGTKKKSIGDLTYDHVVPRSQGGKTTWSEHRDVLRGLQPQEGEPHARAGRHEAAQGAGAADGVAGAGSGREP